MIRLCFKKAFGDLWIRKGRTFLVVISMVIGIIGVGSVLNARAILSREMNANYMKTNPASATLLVQGLNDELTDRVKNLPGIQDVESRRSLSARIESKTSVGKEMILFVVKDFNHLKVSTFFPQKGTCPPKTGEIFIEKAAVDMIDEKTGDNIRLKVSGLEESTLKIGGTVHAPALAPAWMEGVVYGFISLETYEAMGGQNGLNELKFVVSKDPMNNAHITEVSNEIKTWLIKNGAAVVSMEIPAPGRHPHAKQMDTLLFLLAAFGLLTLVLSAIIVASMISAILSQQIRQIGIMKAVGGKNGQIAQIYFSIVLVLGIISLIIAIPFAILAGRGYAAFASNMLNFEIFDASVPWNIYLIQILIGLCLPLLTAFYSILRGSKITVREAIQDYGVSANKTGKQATAETIGILRKVSRPLLISLRNTFRKKGRLFFTLAVLSLGGALFITAMNVSASMNTSSMGLMKSFKFDSSVRFSQAYEKKDLEEAIKQVSGVKAVEVWGGTKAAILKDNGLTGSSFSILAIPPQTKMLETVSPNKGKWLDQKDDNTMVVNQLILTLEPGLKLGDTLQLRMMGKDYPFRITGIVNEILSEPKAYVNQAYFQKVVGQVGKGQSAMISFEDTLSKDKKDVLTKELETSLLEKGFGVAVMERLVDIQDKVEGHLILLATMLIAMSFLGVVVGGMGLSTTMSVNVLERTREIGVMRAIGASTRTVFGIIVGEGTLIGILSWVLAAILAIPFSIYISNFFGTIFFETPLKFSISTSGILIWLVFSMVFAALSSLYPARKAANMSVRESLVYE